jgi:hypothetical protein
VYIHSAPIIYVIVAENNSKSSTIWDLYMAYLGIGYSGNETSFLRELVSNYINWLKGDRLPRFYGDDFIVLYDSNTAREFAKRCKDADNCDAVHIYAMDKQL